jgi:hypothetical protein
MTTTKRTWALAFVLLSAWLLAPAQAQAIDYKIEIVLFEHVNGSSDIKAGLSFPRLSRSLGLASDEAANAGFRLLDSGYELNEAVDEINRSSNYRLLKHFMWQQPGLDSNEAKAVRINVGRVSTVYIPQEFSGNERFVPARGSLQPGFEREVQTTTINGTLKVRLGRFLHLEAHLVHTDAERATSFNLYQSRKMRSRELHYIDNARFGLLARIIPLEDSDT